MSGGCSLHPVFLIKPEVEKELVAVVGYKDENTVERLVVARINLKEEGGEKRQVEAQPNC